MTYTVAEIKKNHVCFGEANEGGCPVCWLVIEAEHLRAVVDYHIESMRRRHRVRRGVGRGD